MRMKSLLIMVVPRDEHGGDADHGSAHHAGDGRYQGTGNVMMSGNWDATVTVTRDGQVAGTKKFPITAK